jgi:hypothetical protein
MIEKQRARVGCSESRARFEMFLQAFEKWMFCGFCDEDERQLVAS